MEKIVAEINCHPQFHIEQVICPVCQVEAAGHYYMLNFLYGKAKLGTVILQHKHNYEHGDSESKLKKGLIYLSQS